jgi:transcription termination/antitermination protein NusG
MAMRWYVIKAINGRENRARDNIVSALKQAKQDEYVNELLIPVERATELKRGRKVVTEHKIYPGYIYAEMEARPDVCDTIRNCDSVTGFLGADANTPFALTNEEAEQIQRVAKAESVEDQRAAMINIPYVVGDRVKVREGTFAGMEGDIEEINEQKGILRVLIAVFGRQTPVELEVWQVEEIA